MVNDSTRRLEYSRMHARESRLVNDITESYMASLAHGNPSLMEFKELFGSFTGHRVENRSTGTRYASTESARSEKWEVGTEEVVADALEAVPDGL
ncbi:hypothetical protein HanRHA438_Chr01g0006491 [Helianthus annuus]|nr:hypothetical protein HanRHA438_Chr01g0006491 [Helianthus annuus]